MKNVDFDLATIPLLRVKQKREVAEIFGFETRNKYAISDESGRELLYAAEQNKGILSFFVRQWFGHWRSFDLHFFAKNRRAVMTAHHPFRWFFQRLDVRQQDGRCLGALQQRFSILSKRFDVEDAQGAVVMTVNSPLWKPWTFVFEQRGWEVAVVRKRWSGLLKEAFLDADNFKVELNALLNVEQRLLVIAAAIFIDLQYFEKKAQ